MGEGVAKGLITPAWQANVSNMDGLLGGINAKYLWGEGKRAAKQKIRVNQTCMEGKAECT